jgi:hypothetical protein
MQLKQILLASIILIHSITSFAADVIKTTPWPIAPPCEHIVIQFQELEFNLPIWMAKRISLLKGDSSQLLVSFAAEPKKIIAIQTLYGFKEEIFPEFRNRGYLQKANIDSVESFFDSLALPLTTKNQEIFHSVLGTEQTVDYYKTSKGPLVAYRNITREPNLQNVIILLEGSDTVYEIAGAISDKEYEYLLSGLTVSNQ